MINKSPGHLHKLKRHRYKTGSAFYFCVNDCSFRVATELSLGKTAECWRCGKPFRMNNYSLTLDKPHCEECHQYKGDKNNRRKQTRRVTDQPLSKVASSIGQEVVDGLKDRLSTAVLNKSETAQATIIEYNPDDEDLL